MIELLSEWVVNLVVVVFLAVMLELFLPATSLRRTVSLVVGFVFVAALLGPFFDRFGSGFADRLEEGRQLEELLGWNGNLGRLGHPGNLTAPTPMTGAVTSPAPAGQDARTRLERKAREQALALYRASLEKQLTALVQNLAAVKDVTVDCRVNETGMVEALVIRGTAADPGKPPPEVSPAPRIGAIRVATEPVRVQTSEAASRDESGVDAGGGSPSSQPKAQTASAKLHGRSPDSPALGTRAARLREQIALYTGIQAERIDVELVGEER